jgi:hypothetical protein
MVDQYAEAEDSEYARAVGALMLVAAVRHITSRLSILKLEIKEDDR